MTSRLLFSGFVGLFLSGCGIMWTSGTSSLRSLVTTPYEYVYFGDANNSVLAGYSINMSSGVLTAIPGFPAELGNINLSVISNTVQLITAANSPEVSYAISPKTGVLNPVPGSGGFSIQSSAGSVQPAVASTSGRYLYSIDAAGTTAWITSLDSQGNIVSSTQTAAFPGPIAAALNTVLSPDGNYVYFYDPANKAIVGYSTAGGALNLVAGVNVGNGTVVGDKTYGLNLLPTPNAGSYTSSSENNGRPYLDVAAGVIYFVYQGNFGLNCWIVPYKIGNDGSLTAGARLNIGTNNFQPGGGMIGDATGNYLFVSPFGNVGLNSYSIGANGALSFISGPIFAGTNFDYFLMNAENSYVVAQSNGSFKTATLNPASGVLTAITTFASACGFRGPMVLDSSEKYIYMATFGSVCGLSIDTAGNPSAISGQVYPLTIPGAGSELSAVSVKLTVTQ